MFHKNIKYIRLGIAALFLLFSVTACEKDPYSGSENTLRLNLGAEPSYLNPILATDTSSSMVNQFLFPGLMRSTPQLSFEPNLAESYSVSKDGKTYYVNIN